MSTKSLLAGVVTVLGIFALTGPQNSYALTYVTQLSEPGSRPARPYRPAPVHRAPIKIVHPPVTKQPRYYPSRDVYRGELTRQLSAYGSTRSNYLIQMKQAQRKYTVNAPRPTGHGTVGHVSGGMIRDY
ncbi:MAG: hypothetical protein JWN70_4335 [Planctomycetaceae bacterium]|nr:hypothetical protein [Planctomycetaceae bacterium]